MEQLCSFCMRELKFYDGCLGYEALRCDYCKIDYTENSISMEDNDSWKLIEEHIQEKLQDRYVSGHEDGYETGYEEGINEDTGR